MRNASSTPEIFVQKSLGIYYYLMQPPIIDFDRLLVVLVGTEGAWVHAHSSSIKIQNVVSWNSELFTDYSNCFERNIIHITFFLLRKSDFSWDQTPTFLLFIFNKKNLFVQVSPNAFIWPESKLGQISIDGGLKNALAVSVNFSVESANHWPGTRAINRLRSWWTFCLFQFVRCFAK